MARDVSHAEPVGLGLIGCGAFGRFCLEQYEQLADVRAIAVADVHEEAARHTAAAFQLEACATPEALLARDDIQMVHLATPPATHRDLAIAALQAGKHVLCEKPLAIRLEDGRAMVQAAREADRRLSVNLIMRYNPLCEAVHRMFAEGLLGQPLHGFFENYAKDEPLGPDHWFWDPTRSGGIFIEHGVHFFDLFRWWLGEGIVVAAQQTPRPGNLKLIEQVQCTVLYGNVLVNFYHGFHQAERMDRQEMRIVCERGDVRLFEWVPTQLVIDTLATDATVARLAELLPGAAVEKIEGVDTRTEPAQRPAQITSRHKSYRIDGRFRITADTGMTKAELYGHVLRQLLADQIRAVRQPAHTPRVSEENGLVSLAIAATADAFAQLG